MPLIRARWWRF